MPGIPISRITTKDIAILETMLSRYNGSCRHFAALLRRKVDSSAIYLRDDIPPDTVTLNSSVAYSVGTTVAGPHLVVQGEIEDLPAFAVSIHSLRGLALLGMSEGESVVTNGNFLVDSESRLKAALSAIGGHQHGS